MHPASPVSRWQISICTAETVLLSQTWDMQLKVYTLLAYAGMYPAALSCIQARLMRDYITGYSSHATHPVLLWQP